MATEAVVVAGQMAGQTFKLMGREEVAEGTMAFHFEKPCGFNFKPGQFADVTEASFARIAPNSGSATELNRTRLTYAFSKKKENLRAALALHFWYYNFARVHSALRITPAMQAGLATTIWTVQNLLAIQS